MDFFENCGPRSTVTQANPIAAPKTLWIVHLRPRLRRNVGYRLSVVLLLVVIPQYTDEPTVYKRTVNAFFFPICAVGLWVLRSLLSYCTSPES
jgi:hypothetical protein